MSGQLVVNGLKAGFILKPTEDGGALLRWRSWGDEDLREKLGVPAFLKPKTISFIQEMFSPFSIELSRREFCLDLHHWRELGISLHMDVKYGPEEKSCAVRLWLGKSLRPAEVVEMIELTPKQIEKVAPILLGPDYHHYMNGPGQPVFGL